MAEVETYTDVVELCALLQCLGFSVKSLDTSDGNISQDGRARTVVINCQSSGLHVVLESTNMLCSCPTQSDQQNSGLWQVEGMAAGKHLDKEFGCTLLGSLPKGHRERLSKELHEMIRCIKQHHESDFGITVPDNRSASMTELKTPDKKAFDVKTETPTMYRSLDTLTGKKSEQVLPEPRPLRPHLVSESSVDDTKNVQKPTMCRRQSTYTVSSTPGFVRRGNKTSSPIAQSNNSMLENLLAAEKTAVELSKKISSVISEFVEERNLDSSMSSLALDVSKISVLKAPETSKAQFASSPNLSGFGNQDPTKSRLKRVESASTSNLALPNQADKDEKTSKLKRFSPKRFSPNIFNSKKDTPTNKEDKVKYQDGKSKFNSLFRPKIVTPVSTPVLKTAAETTPDLSSASKKKYSHIKSTIPRPAKK